MTARVVSPFAVIQASTSPAWVLDVSRVRARVASPALAVKRGTVNGPVVGPAPAWGLPPLVLNCGHRTPEDTGFPTLMPAPARVCMCVLWVYIGVHVSSS